MKQYLILLSAIVLFFSSCQDKAQQAAQQAAYNAVLAEKDTLSAQLDELRGIIGSVTESLDSIDMQEGLLFVPEKDAMKSTKKQMLERVRTYKELLARQREQLDKLEKNQRANQSSLKELRDLVSRLRAEIEEKEQSIANLEQELQKSQGNVSRLSNELNESWTRNALVTAQRDSIQNVSTKQADAIHTAYYIVGEKAALRKAGVTHGIFRAKVDYANLNKSLFNQVDTRTFTELNVNSAKPKLISEKPADSYTITQNANGTSTIRITNAQKFWQASPYLIIQVK